MNAHSKRWAGAALIVALIAAAAPSRAVRTMRWSADPATLSHGDADGVAISRSGVLQLAPRLSRIVESEPGMASQTWAVTADRRGNVFVATGPEGRILRIDPDGRLTTHFSLSEPLVTALAVTRDGSLLAAGAPGGVIYRIDSEGVGGVWSETGERYVWALAVADDGAIYAATGESGSILRIHTTGTPEMFFDSDEAHLVTLATLDGGGLLAGGAGRGQVYQIDPDGNAIVRYADELDEVVALAQGRDGSVVAALIAARVPETPPPALRLRMPDGVEVGGSPASVASLEETTGPLLHGVIEGLPIRPKEDRSRPRGRVVRVTRDGAVHLLWSSATETPYSLVGAETGLLVFGTGEPARLYAIDDGDEVTLLATLPESQVTDLLNVDRGIFAATSNPVVAYRIEEEVAESGVFIVPPFDAGGPARWGSIRWNLEGDPTRAELYTRTGNSETPDDTWSGWSPSMIDPTGNPIENPDGRYVQWRSRFVAGRGSTRLSSVTLEFAPYNRPPRGVDFRLDTAERSIAGEAVFHCSVEDPDQDPVVVSLEYRPVGESTWIEVADAAPQRPQAALPAPVDGWRKQELRWNTDERDEGEYEVRAVVSDEPANHPGEGLRIPLDSMLLTVDRTPPEMVIGIADGDSLPVLLRDAHSAIRALQLRLDGRTRASLSPDDGVNDSRHETFRIATPDETGAWSLVGVDAAGNTAELPLPTPAAGAVDRR